MKLVFIITNLCTGGAETMLLKLLQHLDRGRFQPAVVSLVGMGEIGPRMVALDIPVYSLGMRPGSIPNPLMIIKLVKLLRQLSPDIVHTWMYHADLLGGIAARLGGCRNVVWGIRHSNLSKEENKWSTLMVVKVCAALSSILPTKILSCSFRATQVHVDAGYYADKMHVIPNGFELDRFAPSPEARACVREGLGLATETLLVGLIARYDPQKNHSGFFQAAARVAIRLPSVHFVLVGKGVDENNSVLQEIIRKYGLQSRVHLLGLRDDIPRLMAALDVLASSSSGEAFPNVLGEAMACKVPCVVTDVGDSADIVGDTGRVVAAGDMNELARELVAMLELPAAEKVALGEKARHRVAANYEIGRVAGQYQAFYEQLMQEKKERAH